MSETHVNAFKQDVEEAKQEVAKVLSEAWSKVDALVSKLEGNMVPSKDNPHTPDPDVDSTESTEVK